MKYRKPAQVDFAQKKKKTLLLDIILAISLILVAGALVYMVLNPEKQTSDNNNSRRNADVSTIINAVRSYAENIGNIPENINITDKCTAFGNEICKSTVSDCTNYTDLKYLTTDQLKELPVDPNATGNGTGYYISQDGAGNLTVCAPYSERGVSITVTQAAY